MLKPKSVKKKPRNGKLNSKKPVNKAYQCPDLIGQPREKRRLDERKMAELQALFQRANETAPVTETEIASAAPESEADPEPQLADVEAE